MIDSQAFNQPFLNETPPTFAKSYLFYGQTPFLSEEGAQLLVKSAKQHGFSQRDIFYLDNRAKTQSIKQAMQSPGLFDPKKIIELRFDTDKPTKKIGEQVAELAEHQSNNLLIIQAGNLNYQSQKEKWFTRITQQATSVVAKPIYSNQLPNWIHQRAEHLNVKLSTDALQTIVRYSEGNLLWTNQILMQLAHSDYPQPIALGVVETMLTDLSVFQIDDLCRAILAKNTQALKVIQKLEQENQPLVLITSSLYRDIETLHALNSSGENPNQVFKARRIWPNKQRQYQQSSHLYSPTQLTKALRQLAELDKANKGMSKGDGWLMLTQLVSELIIVK